MKPRIIGFLLIPEFGLLSYASAIEPLRAANELSGRTLYRWCHLSPDGRPVYASNGISISPDERLQHAIGELDALFVLAGGKRIFFNDAATFGQLRRFGRLGRPIGGIGGGPYVLARAGLLDGYRFTLHREYAQALMEELPDLERQEELVRGRSQSIDLQRRNDFAGHDALFHPSGARLTTGCIDQRLADADQHS